MSNLDRVVMAFLNDTATLGDLRTALAASLAKPVVHPDRDLSCGLSTEGIVVCGDRASIAAVRLKFDQLEYHRRRSDSLERQLHKIKGILK